MAEKNKKQKNEKVEPTKKKSKRKIIIKYFIIILVISLLMFMTYRYTEEAKERSYINGGQNAIATITEVAQNKGGVAIIDENKTIILSKYDKITAITASVIEETVNNETVKNQTE